ncbi:MAG: hypothetical protein AB1505_35835, partial [Candidatus Latescibacterota bacterium]
MGRIPVVLLAAVLAGCASSPPPWHGGFLDSLGDVYDQGAGAGASIERADRNAQVALVGYQQGIDIESVTEDQVQSFQKAGDELIVEVMTSKGLQKVSGTLPPGSYIAERWQDGSGTWWSFAVSEKPGQERRIQEQRSARLGAARLRSPVPGWSQFTKGQKQKGWRILGAEGLGVVGFTTFAILQNHYDGMKDDPDLSEADLQYYTDWADRSYWAKSAFGILAAGTYLYSLVDGITSLPPTYRLLLSRLEAQPRRDGGLAVV